MSDFLKLICLDTLLFMLTAVAIVMVMLSARNYTKQPFNCDRNGGVYVNGKSLQPGV